MITMNIKGKAYYFIIGFLFLMITPVSAQDQKVADSLAKIYKQDIADDTAKLELLRNLSFNEGKDLKLALMYAEELIRLSEKMNNKLYLHRGYLQKGNKKRLLGDLEEALEACIKSVEAAMDAKFIEGEGVAYTAIADIYSISNNHPNAKMYYSKAIATLRKSDDSITLASAISNAGDEYLNTEDYDTALIYFRESGIIFEKADYLIGKAYSLGNIGIVYANTGEHSLAEKNINHAIKILEEAGDYYPICVYLISMCDIYLQKGDRRNAVSYAMRSLKLAEQYGLKEQISDANLKLSQLFEKDGKLAESFKYYKNHIAYRDSVNDIRSVQK